MMRQRTVLLTAAMGAGLLALSPAWAAKDINLRATWDHAEQSAAPKTPVTPRDTSEDLIAADFESGMPATWFLDTANGSPGWQADIAANASSQFMPFPDHTTFAYVNSDGAGDGVTMDDMMMTDLFDIPEGVDCFLQFETLWNEGGTGDYQGFGEVLFASDGGDFVQIYDMNANGDVLAWDQVLIDLSEFAGSNFCQVAFHYWDDGNWSYGWGVDDVLLFTATGDEFPPEITAAPMYNHLDINAGIHLMADIVDPSDIMSAQIHYRMGGGEFMPVDMLPVAGDTWEGTIPGIGGPAIVEWKIVATDFSENENTAETESYYTEVSNEAWLHNDLIGDTSNGVGSPASPWECAVFFDPGVYPITLSEIEIGGFNNDVTDPDVTIDLRIWDDNAGEPGTVLFSSDGVTHPNADFGVFDVDPAIEVTGPFYVGCSVIANHRVYVDQPGYFWPGVNMLNIDGGGWDVMEDYEIEDNFMVHVFGTYDIDVDVEPTEILPRSMQLSGSYPNPFNPSTEIAFELASNQHVRLNIYNLNGELVEQLHNGMLPAGANQLTWNAEGLASGMYLAVLSNGVQQETIKLSLVR